MLEKIITLLLALVGLVNLLPLVAFFDANQCRRLYGVAIESESMAILMRHRAVLLGLVGLALIAAALKAEYRAAALSAALISKCAFIFLVFAAGDYSSEIKRVALIDVAALVLLMVVLMVQLADRRLGAIS